MTGSTNNFDVGNHFPDRLFLCQPTPEDEHDFLVMTRASRKLHHPWIEPPTTSVGYASYLERVGRPDYRGLMVRRELDNEIVGVFNLSQIFRGPFQNAYLGFYAAAPHAGKGYMYRGLNLVLREAFTAMKLHRVEANIQPANARSKALVAGVGFSLEGFSPRYLKVRGRWRDHERWAIRSEQWRSHQRHSRRAVGETCAEELPPRS